MNSNSARILVCDDEEYLCYMLKERLVDDGYTSVDLVFDGKEAIEGLKKKNYDLLLLDLELKEVHGEEVLKFISDNEIPTQVIVITGQTELRKAIECIKLGAYDYITKPYKYEQVRVSVDRALEHKDLIVTKTVLTYQLNKTVQHNIIGESKNVAKVLNLANKAALSDSNVLIEGETGTGKELFAEYVHKQSKRKDKPFVIVNCASLPDQLIESELFGHEKGAFTDAKTSKQGLVEIAHGGTLFLDEIGELSLTLQPKLLRFLENGEYRRIGGTTNLNSDVRVIGATNRNLLEEVEKKNFRRDLLFRLNVITLTIPPLRDRGDDVIILANHFLESKSSVRNPKKLSLRAEETLRSYNFPGNVRELQHLIERAIIFSEGDLIEPEDFNMPRNISQSSVDITEEVFEDNDSGSVLSMEEIEKKHIAKALRINRWDRTQTANQLGISPKTLYTKIKKYEIKQE
jgi:DNA-binding NtrC family response regulator